MSLRVYSAQKYSTRSYNNGADPAADPANPRPVFLLKAAAGGAFSDLSSNNYTVTNPAGNFVSSSSTTVKFDGTYSASFSGSNFLYVADTAALRPGTGSFTWEFWWYPTSLSSYRTPLGKGYVSAGDLALQTGSGDGKLIAYASGSPALTSSVAVTVNTWSHIALVRSGTAMALYINGTSAATATNSTNFNSTSVLQIGDANNGSSSGYGSVGYIQDVRITGSAIYTANFTPPGSLS